MQFHHVGVASGNATELAVLYEDLFDAPVVHEETFDGMSVVFLGVDGGYFELLEPLDGGVIARFLDDRGAGVHHVALATEDLETALVTASERGVSLIDEEPRPGAWGHQVAFLHPKSTGGVLVELVQE